MCKNLITNETSLPFAEKIRLHEEHEQFCFGRLTNHNYTDIELAQVNNLCLTCYTAAVTKILKNSIVLKKFLEFQEGQVDLDNFDCEICGCKFPVSYIAKDRPNLERLCESEEELFNLCIDFNYGNALVGDANVCSSCFEKNVKEFKALMKK
jgi:hypothetical protein